VRRDLTFLPRHFCKILLGRIGFSESPPCPLSTSYSSSVSENLSSAKISLPLNIPPARPHHLRAHLTLLVPPKTLLSIIRGCLLQRTRHHCHTLCSNDGDMPRFKLLGRPHPIVPWRCKPWKTASLDQIVTLDWPSPGKVDFLE
jgi:hypothetical protein